MSTVDHRAKQGANCTTTAGYRAEQCDLLNLRTAYPEPAALWQKLMERNDGYVSDTKLYEYVRAEMQMFLNDNGISSSAMVYDLARHLFEKVGYHGKHYSFSNKTHISRVGNEQIGSVLDVMCRYAREQGGIFAEEDLVQYLQNVGLKTGNLHGQMKLNEEPIFLYYQPDVLITGESLQLNEAWFAKAHNGTLHREPNRSAHCQHARYESCC